MTFQQKLLLGFGLMVLPVLLVGAEAIRSNALERRALETLGESLTRTRTYSEVETAMFNQGEVIWRSLSGLEPRAREEFRLSGEVVDYWLDRWSSELQPDEQELAVGVRRIETEIRAVADSVFALEELGKRPEAYALAKGQLKERLLPALTEMNHQIYRRAREFSVSRAFSRVAEIVNTERTLLFWIMLLSVVAGLTGAWLIARSLARPIGELRQAMTVVGSGDLDHPITPRSGDEIGDLARSFRQMTGNLRQSRAELVHVNAELAAKIGQLETAQARLVEQEKLASVGQMAAGVAHGLRNPLASLRASAQLALRHPDSPAARESLESMISEVDRLDKRITHLLTFSRPAPLHPMRENLATLVAGLLPPLNRLLQERAVALRTDLPADLPDTMLDPMKLEQTMHELIANALDAMPGGGTLGLSARASEDRASVTVEITDTGKGIPAEVLPAVTDPFFTTRPEGTGLGLAIAKRFVEQNGGTLDISSTVGRGTQVRIHFPAAPAMAGGA
jgi:signal transduction histidine kinase